MPIFNIRLIPQNKGDDFYRRIYEDMVAVVMADRQLQKRFEDHRQLSFCFNADLMEYGMGEEVVIEVTRMPQIEGVPWARIAAELGLSITTLLPDTKLVNVYIGSETAPLAEWSSADMEINFQEWCDRTMHLSETESSIKSRLGQLMLRYKEPLVRHIFKSVAEKEFDAHIMRLLHELTGEDPVHEYDRGKIRVMAAFWMGWGRTAGYDTL